MAINPNQINNDIAFVSNALASEPSPGAGQGAWFVETVSGVAEFFYKDDQGQKIQLTNNGSAAGGGGGCSVSDTAYGPGWDGDTTTAASKNALFDKLDSVDTAISNNTSSIGSIVSADGSISTHSDVASGGSDGQVLVLSSGTWTPTTLPGGGDLLSTNNLSDVANASTALSNLGGLEASANLSDVANASTALGNLGGLAAASNLSDVANATTALSNLGGLNATNIVPQGEAEAGTATTARVWTAQRVSQAIAALGGGGGGGSANEFRFQLPQTGGSLNSRIAGVTNLPAGWSLDTADTAGVGEFGSDADTLVVTWDVSEGSKLAQIHVFQETTAGPAVTQGLQELDLWSAAKVKTSVAQTEGAAFLNGTGLSTTKDIEVVVRLL